MAFDAHQANRRLVVAPLGASVSVVVTLVLAGIGGWLIATSGGPLRMSFGIAVLWVGLNVLIVGLVSSTAWRRRSVVVGGERVAQSASAAPREGSRHRHGVVLTTPGGQPARTLHGFVTLREQAAVRLAGRLNGLLGATTVDGPTGVRTGRPRAIGAGRPRAARRHRGRDRERPRRDRPRGRDRAAAPRTSPRRRGVSRWGPRRRRPRRSGPRRHGRPAPPRPDGMTFAHGVS